MDLLLNRLQSLDEAKRLETATTFFRTQQLHPLTLLRGNHPPELRRLVVQTLPHYYRSLPSFFSHLSSWTEHLRYEQDSEVKRLMLAYLQQTLYQDVPHSDQQWPSFWDKLAQHMAALQPDPEFGRQVDELAHYAEAQRQARIEALLTRPGSRKMIAELARYGDARALPPQPDNFPLKSPAQAAIAAIRARLESDAASKPDSNNKPGQNE